MADEVLQQGVRGITDLMVMPGLINLDFADVRSVMQEMGKAMMGTGESSGDNRALEAAQKAIANPLLDGVSMKGAKGVIISITGGEDMRLMEVDEAANHIRDLVDEDANIIWGSAFNSDLDGKIRVSVVATGIEAQERPAAVTEAPTRAFSFNTPKKAEAEPAPVAAAPAFEPTPAPEPVASDPPAPTPQWAVDPPTAGAAIPTGYEPQAPAAETPIDAGQGGDELLLDAGTMVPDDGVPAGSARYGQPGARYGDEPAAERRAAGVRRARTGRAVTGRDSRSLAVGRGQGRTRRARTRRRRRA